MRTSITALHGFLGSPEDWQNVAWSLSDFKPQTRFFKPKITTQNLSITDWARKINQQISMMEDVDSKHVILGYSMGARLALECFLAAPDFWSSVILVSCHPGLMSDDEKMSRRAHDQNWAEDFRKMKWNELLTKWNSQSVFENSKQFNRIESDYMRDDLARQLTEWSLGKQDFRGSDYKEYRDRMLWICGENDKKYCGMYENMCQDGLISNIAVLPGAGHRVHVDSPAQLATHIANFIDKH